MSDTSDSTRAPSRTHDETLDSQPGEGSLWKTITRGRQLGRYVMLRRLARGGMGEVWLAWDPELDRDVAIKLLRARASDERAGARLQREARAMARLAHPNIVTVYDVGTVEGQVFVAMEYVRGQTLSAWAKQARTWREVLDVYLAAGRGLAAAHAADMVHRDFKPDNAMIDERGRVRVMDFGLAHARGPGLASESHHDSELRGELEHEAEIAVTRAGALLGTPAYMAPEQFQLEVAGPAADQFAFAVALWEAIYRQRPFAGPTVEALAQQVQDGQRRTVPKRSGVPGRVRRVLERALEPEPTQRWPSMNAMLLALARARTRSTGVWVGVAGMLAAGLAFGWWMRPEPPSLELCPRDQLTSSQRWSDRAREQVLAGLRASGRPHAEHTAPRVATGLDAWVGRWTAVERDACLEVDGLPDELRVGQALCFAQLEDTLDATLSVLGQADAEVADRALELVAGLPEPSRCADARALASGALQPDDPTLAREVEGIRAQLAELVALREVGRIADAHAMGVPLVERARASAYPPVLGEVLGEHAWVLVKRGEYEPASVHLREAYRILLGHGAIARAAELADDLVFTLGVKLRRFDEAEVWALQAEALDEQAAAGPERELVHLASLGALRDAQGRYADAIDLYRRALAIGQAQQPRPLTGLAQVHEQLGITQGRLGQLAEAVREQELALQLFEEQLGATHPTLGTAWLNLGNSHYMAGDLDAAKRAFERALAIYAESLGPDHPFLGSALTGLGAIQLGEDDPEGARESFARALGLAEAKLGPDHLDLVPPLNNLGIAQARLGELDAAERSARRALGLLERANGSEHPDLVATLDTLASLLARQAEHAEARTLFERSLRIGEASFGPEHLELAYALLGLGTAAEALAAPDEAERWYRRALALIGGAPTYASMAAQAELGLARLALAAGDRAGSTRWIAAARARVAAGGIDAETLRAIEAAEI